MASFVSVPGAVSCAVSVQQALAEQNRQALEGEPLLRIGLHAGEPIEEHEDLFGNAVQLAARLCAAAGPSDILVSETIRGMAGGSDVPFEDRGTFGFKGFPNSVRVFSIRWSHQMPSG